MKILKKDFNSTGFTLIEILVVVAILAILFAITLITLDGSKKRSKVAATKTTLNSLKGPLAVCCSVPANSLNNAGSGGGDVCSSPINSILPTALNLSLGSSGNVSYTGDLCSATSPSISALIAGHIKSQCNGAWTITENLVTPPAGC